MKVFNARDPQAISYIEEHLKPDGDYDLGSYVEMLKNVLTYSKDNVFLPIIIDGEEVLGFIIAIAPGQQDHVWIIQSWFSDKLDDPKRRDLLFIKLILWSLQKGRRTIRGEIKLDESNEQFNTWDFKHHSEILSYDIGDDFEERILAQREKTSVTSGVASENNVEAPSPKVGKSIVFGKKGQ